jgi:hypothetical protein
MVTGIIDYLFFHASAVAAQAELSSLYGDKSTSFVGIKATSTQTTIGGVSTSAGHWSLVSRVGRYEKFTYSSNCVVVLDRDSGAVLSSRLTTAGTQSLRFWPIPAGSCYASAFAWKGGLAQAADAGYTTTTFLAATFSAENVDIDASYQRGFQFYMANYFGSSPAAASAATFNQDGTISLFDQDGAVSNVVIGTAGKLSSAPGFIGMAFGGGAYISAEIAFDPATVDLTKGCPAFWTMAVEHLCLLNAPNDTVWAGQPSNFKHYIEVDIFEFARDQSKYPTAYGATVRDWYGIWPPWLVTDSDFNDGLVFGSPTGVDYTAFNTVAMLWVPATATSKGFIRFFLNDSQVGPTISWDQYNDQPPPPDNAPWKFGIIDRQHLCVMAGSSSGAIKVKSITVLQGAGASNLVN